MTDVQVHTNGKVDEKARQKLERMKRLDTLRENGWKLPLPGDQWVQFRDPKAITESQRRAYKEAGTAMALIGQRIEAALESGQLGHLSILEERQAAAVIRSTYIGTAMFIDSWSFEWAVPNASSTESFGLLSGETYDRIQTAAEDLLSVAFLDTSVSSDIESPFFDSAD